jgi:hypothetical protein
MTLRRAAPSQWVVPGRGSYVGGRRLRHRLPCDARSEVASQNSLRSLRSLRSDSCDESDGRSAPRRADFGPVLLGAAQIAAAGHRPSRIPGLFLYEQTRRSRKGACGQDAGRLGSAEQRSERGPRAQRASSSDSSQLFERSDRRERSEFCDGAAVASSTGQPKAASDEALRPARMHLCLVTTR